jgi:hypothetical protein
VRQTCRWQPKALAVEIATRLKKELLAQSLSCTQVSRTLGHALSATRSSPTVVEVICMIRGGGWSSGPMMMKPRAKGVLGSEDKLYERKHQMAKQSGVLSVTSGQWSLLRRRGKKSPAIASFYRGKGERVGAGPCHTRFLYQNQVLIVCMTHDQLFHTYCQKCS